MSESQTHMDLVDILYDFVTSIINDDEINFIQVDKPDSLQKPVKVINNFLPDLYYKWNNKLIIGEAKTEEDIERKHSIEQYESYIDECASYRGEKIIVFCVPLYGYNTIKNRVRIIKNKKKYDSTIIFLDDTGRISKL